MNVVLFTGPECHLCDLAMVEIENLNNQHLNVEKRNIRDNAQDYHLYAVKIPVLKRVDTGAELNWPFTQHDIATFIL